MSKLKILNELTFIDMSISSGECEYVHVENNEENIEVLKELGATNEDIENMTYEDDPDIVDITMFAFDNCEANYFSVEKGFTK